MNIINLVARSHLNRFVFQNHELSRWIWNELQNRFPDARAVILMPNHLHLVVDAANETAPRILLSDILRITSIRFKLGPGAWQPVPDGRIVADRKHLQRLIRYIYLNPCRAKLTDDPLKWEFSTLREALALRLTPWPGIQKSLSQLGYEGQDGRMRFHRYTGLDVTAVQFCEIQNTGTHEISRFSALQILQAILAFHSAKNQKLHLSPQRATLRWHLAWLLKDQGYRDILTYSEILATSRSQTWRIKNLPPPELRVQKLLRIHLADARLRNGYENET
jgi:hypothetical protein